MDLSGCSSVNHLWPSFVEKLGFERAQTAVQQALDLQSMQGDNNTLPVLFLETCGLALTSFDNLRCETGLSFEGSRIVLLFSNKSRSVQLLREISS